MTIPRRRCIRCGRNRAERFYVGVKGKVCLTCRKARVRGATKKSRLRHVYGITPEEYAHILEAQKGKCAICLGHRTRYDVDHSHRLERNGLLVRETIRGLLCARCNRRLLPSGQDDPALFDRAAEYLRTLPAQAILDSLPFGKSHDCTKTV